MGLFDDFFEFIVCMGLIMPDEPEDNEKSDEDENDNEISSKKKKY